VSPNIKTGATGRFTPGTHPERLARRTSGDH